MAMLGKRSFQRTISMSQIGPGSNLQHTDNKSHAQPSAIHPADSKPLSPTHDSQKQLLLQAAALQWEALKARQQQADDHHHHHLHLHQKQSPWEALKGVSPQQDSDHTSSLHKQHEVRDIASPDQREILKNAEAIRTMLMQAQSSQYGNSSNGSSSVNNEGMAVAAASSPIEVPHQLPYTGLWRCLGSPVTSPFFSHSHLLHSCFLCKQRLRHEHDIFMYRGDAAFCSEECRLRQILTDETCALRASTKGGST